MTEKITILIADDHPIFREGIRKVLERESSFFIIAEAEDGEAALHKILELKPDVAILDINMPKMTGLTVAQRVSAMNLTTNIMLLTMLDDKKIFLEAMDAGVKGYILKDSAVAEILKAVTAVNEDRHYISPTLSGILLQKKGILNDQQFDSLKNLTPTEVRILDRIADLKTNQEIADELFVSKRTVENHRTNIAQKLNLKSTNGVLKFALQHKSDLNSNT